MANKTLSKSIIDILTTNNIKPELVDLVSNNEWQKAFDLADTNSRNVIVKAFFKQLNEPNGPWKNVDWEKIEEVQNILIKIFSGLGFRKDSNPFISFIKEHLSKSNSKLSNEQLISLNNLWANGVLDLGDIAGIGPNKLKHVIFNPNLYTIEDSDIFEFIIKTYEWLSEMTNIKKMNFDALNDSKLPNSVRELSNEEIKDAKQVRDVIIYKDPSNPLNSEINSEYVIDKILNVASNVSKEGQEKEGNVTKIATNLKEYSNEDKEELIKSLLKDNEIKNLIKNLLKEED